MELLNNFFMFVAPWLTVIFAIIFSMWFASKDDIFRKEEAEENHTRDV